MAPSIFAPGKHGSRSERYAYIPTDEVLRGLRREGFEPFMVCQSRTRTEDRRGYTMHLIHLRHVLRYLSSQIARPGQQDGEANEIVLVNSLDGSSAYQVLAGVFRFVCHNGLVCGADLADIRIPHKAFFIATEQFLRYSAFPSSNLQRIPKAFVKTDYQNPGLC